MTTAILARSHALRRVLGFALETHPPLLYLPLAMAWALSLSMLLLLERGAVHFVAPALGLGLVFFLILLYLRAIDEIKDLEYDRLHHPTRPLVRGAVCLTEVWTLAGVTALTVLLWSAQLDAWLAVPAGLQMLYALMLLWLERRVPAFRASILLNLGVTFPVSALLNIYPILYFSEPAHAPSLTTAATVVAAHVCIFLHMEFGRKLKRPELATAGENGYAQVLGMRGAMIACALFGVVACALASSVLAASGVGVLAGLPWFALLPSGWALLRCCAGQVPATSLKLSFGGAMLAFFVLNGAAVLCAAAPHG